MTKVISPAKHIPFREQLKINAPLPEFRSHTLKVGFPNDMRVKLLQIVSKLKVNDDPKVGSQLTDQEANKSGKSPFLDDFLINTDYLKDLLCWTFQKLFQNSKQISNMLKFPYPVKMCISVTHPKVLNDNIQDLLRNYFNVDDLSFIYLENCIKNSISISFGHNSVKIYNRELFESSNMNSGIQILPIGSKDLTLSIQQNLAAKYSFFSQNISFDFSEFIKLNCCNFQPYYTEESNLSIMEKYQLQYNNFVSKLSQVIIPAFKIDNISERQNYSNFVGKNLTQIPSNYSFVQTSLPFTSLFNQQQLIELNDFGKRARATNIQKLINLSKIQQTEDLENQPIIIQLQIIKQNSAEQLNVISAQIKQLERRKQIQSSFENALNLVDFGDTYMDIQKLQNHLYNNYNELNQCLLTCNLQLNDLGLSQHAHIQFPPIQYYNFGAACLQNDVILPIFGEQIYAQESYFFPENLNLNCLNIVEGVRNCLNSDNFTIGIYGAVIPGIEFRIMEECCRFGCSNVIVLDEFSEVSKTVMEGK